MLTVTAAATELGCAPVEGWAGAEGATVRVTPVTVARDRVAVARPETRTAKGCGCSRKEARGKK